MNVLYEKKCALRWDEKDKKIILKKKKKRIINNEKKKKMKNKFKYLKKQTKKTNPF